MHLVDFPLCERIELLHFYFAGVPKCSQLRLVQYLPLNTENLLKCYYGPLILPYFNNEAGLDADLAIPSSEIHQKLAKLLPLAQ